MATYEIKPAPYTFNCPVYGDLVKKGENYAELEGEKYSMKILEEKKLVPVSPSTGERKEKNPFGRGSVAWENLHMRIELEIIAENPDSISAKKIIEKYRRRMKARKERLLSAQN